jgi:pullulanase
MKAKTLILLASAALLLGVASCASLPEEGGEGSVVIHYHRTDGDYSDWDLWVWPSEPNEEGQGYAFGAADADGFVTASIPVESFVTEVGFIVRQGGDGWSDKDIADDRFSRAKEFWLLQGDPEVYTAKPAVK